MSMITSVIEGVDWSTCCIFFWILNDFTIFIFIMNCYITENFIIDIDNTSCSLDNLTAFLALCSCRVNAVCLTIRRYDCHRLMICCVVGCSYFRCWCINNAWCNSVAFLILIINNNITVLFWSFHKIIVVNDIGIAFDHFTSFRSLSCG